MCATFVFACCSCQWCMHSLSYCCRGFVEAYRYLLELVCETWNVTLEPGVEAYLAMGTSMMDRHWVGIRCEASGVSEATPAVAETSEATCMIWVLLLYKHKHSFTSVILVHRLHSDPPLCFVLAHILYHGIKGCRGKPTINLNLKLTNSTYTN